MVYVVQVVWEGERNNWDAEWGGIWGGVSPPQPTRVSEEASWAPPVGSGVKPRPETHFGHIFLLIEHVWQSEKCAEQLNTYYSNLAKFYGACLRVQNSEEARASVPHRHGRLCSTYDI